MKSKRVIELLLGGTLVLSPTMLLAADFKPESEIIVDAREKILKLEDLIDRAEIKGLDTQREECAVWMANTFLMYADWDERNVEQNVFQYETWVKYKDDAQRLAEELPDFQREEVVKLLDSAIEELEAVIEGDIVRRDVPKVDWASIKLDGDQFVSNGRYVYINDYFTKPTLLLNDYCGKVDIARLNIGFLDDSGRALSEESLNYLQNKDDKYSGYVFLWHSKAPQWILDRDPNANLGGRHFTGYDVDNPLIRDAWRETIKAAVPLMRGKRYTDLGYILSNEPHFISSKDVWATSAVSDYTLDKFRDWLSSTHGDIARLNSLWGTKFADFDSVEFEVPFDGDLRGTPAAYDWMKFNQVRITEWFTFLADEIRKYDPDAKIHVKLVPRLFRQDQRDHGIDYEQLMQMSDILGNDAKITGRLKSSKGKEDWEDRFCFNWVDVGVPYDFFESVAPNKTNINSESHFLSSTGFREIELSREFTRSAYWLATMQGMTISYSWFWAREYDGGVRYDLRGGTEWGDKAMKEAYVASVVQQPRVAHEVATTYMDMNAFSEEIAALQRLARPARIFYSEAAAINKDDYMAGIIDLHTPLFFEGNQVGFVTESVLRNQDINEWGVVLVKGSERVLQSEVEALQSYLDSGGVVVIDSKSLKMNEYGEKMALRLKQSKGKLIKASSDADFVKCALSILDQKGMMPSVVVEEENEIGERTVLWRVVEGKDGGCVINFLNLGRSDATIKISARKQGQSISSVEDMMSGKEMDQSFTLASQQVRMVKVEM